LGEGEAGCVGALNGSYGNDVVHMEILARDDVQYILQLEAHG
jgi:hypothetical protein